jgi:hypothetical protein
LLYRTLNSLLAQDITDPYEVIVISDGDTSARDVVPDSVKYIELATNQGQGAALNAGLAEAQGDYLCVVHDDDIAKPNKLRVLSQYLSDHPDAGIVSSLSETIDADDKINSAWNDRRIDSYRKKGAAGSTLFTERYGSHIDGAATMYRAQAVRGIGGWSEDLNHAEELDLHLRIMLRGWRVGFVDEITSQYRVGGQNKSLDADGHMPDRVMGVGRTLRDTYRDDVHVCISSVARRQCGLKRVVKDLLPQCEMLHIFLADYPAIPDFLVDPKIDVVLPWEADRGSIEKFRWRDQVSGYYVTCDDDILYPKDYTAQIIADIERHNRTAVIGYHGAIITAFPVDNYYRQRTLYHFAKETAQDTPVHVIGNVAGAHHTDTIQFRVPEMKPPHTQDDIWLAIAAQTQGVPMVCCKKRAGWIKSNDDIDQRDSIYEQLRRGSQVVSDSINALGEWGMPSRIALSMAG